MAKHGPGVRQHGTARDADNAPGYTASGTSEHSRHSAHGAKSQVEEPDFAKGKPIKRRTRLELIRDNRRELDKVKKKLEIERDPIRIEKLKRSVELKSYFLHKLEEEQRHERQSSDT